jgi:hypothetical protein
MNRLLKHLRANVIAYLALFVALGGSSYAAFSLPAGSVGTSQLRNGSITPIKFNSWKIGAYVRAWAVISPSGKLLSARPGGAQIVAWDPNYDTGLLRWPTLSRACFALADGADGFVRATVLAGPGSHAAVQFETYGPTGQPAGQEAEIAVLCPSS